MLNKKALTLKEIKMPKSNPYDPNYVMLRDNCSYDEAMNTIQSLKSKNAWNAGKSIQKKNPYDPTYVMLRDNCSYEDAIQTIECFKKNKATSLENFIKKYGQSDGMRRYNEWKEKSLSIGHKVARQNGASQSKFSQLYYLRHGYSADESMELALQYQKENSPLHVEYYIKRGHNFEYAKAKIRQIHDKKIGRDCYREYLENLGLTEDEIIETIIKSRGHCTIKNLGTAEFKKRIEKTRNTFEKKGIWVPLNDMSDYKLYHRKVWEITNQNDLSQIKNYEKRGRAGQPGAFHLDHKFSISRGYIEKISPEIIGSIKNLEFIPWEENVTKQGKCSVLLEEISNES